jgi:hypothetical protein
MTPAPRLRLLQALSIAIAALPFAFALIRFVKSGSDVRYFWVALASFLGAITVVLGGGRQRPTLQAALTRSAAAFVIATLFAVLAGLLLGTTLGPGILVVAAAFGLCSAVSCALHLLTRCLVDQGST